MFKISPTVAFAMLSLGFVTACTSTTNVRFDEVTLTTEQPLASFETVYIAPVETDLEADERSLGLIRRSSIARRVGERDQQLIADRLHKRLSRVLGADNTIIDTPTDDALIIKATITQLASSRPTFQDYEDVPGLNAFSVFAGGAEVEFVLVAGNTEIGRISESDFGSLSDGLPRAGIWSDVDSVMPRMARKLAAYIATN